MGERSERSERENRRIERVTLSQVTQRVGETESHSYFIYIVY